METKGYYLKGIHHVSAITGDAAANYEFYTRVLGLRLVKKTVNQDDTSVYHLFYGDERGNPGTDLTFFEIRSAPQYREGVGGISAVSLRVASNKALYYWKERFAEIGIDHDTIIKRGNRQTLAFRDGEGQRLILVSDEGESGVACGKPWDQSPVPAQYAITGIGPVHLSLQNCEPTALVLTGILGFRYKAKYASPIVGQADILVFETGEGGSGAEVHLEQRNDLPRERQGKGGIHHVAFRVENDEELREWAADITRLRVPNSGFVDRYYFRSLYFREPNGIMFELATDGPGFDTDESMLHLGEKLALPPFLEPHRARIEAGLHPIETCRE